MQSPNTDYKGGSGGSQSTAYPLEIFLANGVDNLCREYLNQFLTNQNTGINLTMDCMHNIIYANDFE